MHKADDKYSVNLPIEDSDLEALRDGASEAYEERNDTHAYWELRLIAKIDSLRLNLLRAEEIARSHGVTWGENRGTLNPSTVPQEEIASAIASLMFNN